MSAERFEAFLARLYVDAEARARFKANPSMEARNAGLTDAECRSLENVDWSGLQLAAKSYARKRALKQTNPQFTSQKAWWRHLLSFFAWR